MEEEARRVAALLKVLANEHRLLLLCALIEEPRTVSELAAYAGTISQSALSQHLALLRAHGVLDCKKNGQRMLYWIADVRVEAVVEVLRRQYCTPGQLL